MLENAAKVYGFEETERGVERGREGKERGRKRGE